MVLKKIISRSFISILLLASLIQNTHAQSCIIDTMKVRTKLIDWLSYVKYVNNNNLNHDLNNTYYTISICYSLLGMKDSSIYYLPKNHTSFGNLTDIFYEGYTGTQWDSAVQLITSDFYDKNQNLTNPNLTKDILQLSYRQQSLLWYGTYLKSPKCNNLIDHYKIYDISTNQLLEKLSISKYLTTNEIGIEGMNSLFLLIQHLEKDNNLQKDFQQKIENILLENNFSDTLLCKHYAYLTDRILVNNGKLQEFGTQFNTQNKKLYPIREPETLNIRREKLHLSPINLNNKK